MSHPLHVWSYCHWLIQTLPNSLVFQVDWTAFIFDKVSLKTSVSELVISVIQSLVTSTQPFLSWSKIATLQTDWKFCIREILYTFMYFETLSAHIIGNCVHQWDNLYILNSYPLLFPTGFEMCSTVSALLLINMFFLQFEIIACMVLKKCYFQLLSCL